MGLEDENRAYWNRRAESYAHINYAQLHGDHAHSWEHALLDPLHDALGTGDPEEMHILDIGCGPGIFTVLLANEGFRVTAADYTPGMLEQARKATRHRRSLVDIVRADAQDLPFPDATFDAVVSRNLTWNLPHPERAYAEWARVLAPGGVIVNFDANWYRHLVDEEALRAYEHDRELTAQLGMPEECEIEGYEAMDEIARRVPLTTVLRPAWDERVLRDLGLAVEITHDIGQTVWNADELVNFASTPLFRIVARKPATDDPAGP